MLEGNFGYTFDKFWDTSFVEEDIKPCNEFILSFPLSSEGIDMVYFRDSVTPCVEEDVNDMMFKDMIEERKSNLVKRKEERKNMLESKNYPFNPTYNPITSTTIDNDMELPITSNNFKSSRKKSLKIRPIVNLKHKPITLKKEYIGNPYSILSMFLILFYNNLIRYK